MTRPLKVENQSFSIMKAIDGAPAKKMWVRELLKNAIESTQSYISSSNIDIPTPIKIRALPLNDYWGDYSTTAPKASFLNYGGMRTDELNKAVNFYSSVNKTQSDDCNFGIGAKLNVIGWSDMIWITMKQGIASTCTLTIQNGVPQILDGGVVECTQWARENAEHRGYDLEHDWTEIIIFGKTTNQNTLTHTFGDGQKIPVSNMIKDAFFRFADIPDGIEIIFESGLTNATNTHSMGNKAYPTGVELSTKEQVFKDITRRHSEARTESVYTDNGFKINYYYEPLSNDGIHPVGYNVRKPFSNGQNVNSLIWGKNNEKERFDILSTNQWRNYSTRLGIIADHTCFSVDVELPYSNFKTPSDRYTLRSIDDDDYNTTTYSDFLPLIREYAPEWFNEKIRDHNQKATSTDITERLQKQFASLYSEYDDVFGNGIGPNTGKREKRDRNGQKKVDNNFYSLFDKSEVKKKRSGFKVRNATVGIKCPTFVANTQNSDFFAEFVYGDIGGEDVVYYNSTHYAIEQLVNSVVDINDNEEIVSNVQIEATELLKLHIGTYILLCKCEKSDDRLLEEIDEFTSSVNPYKLELQIKQHRAEFIRELKAFYKKERLRLSEVA